MANQRSVYDSSTYVSSTSPNLRPVALDACRDLRVDDVYYRCPRRRGENTTTRQRSPMRSEILSQLPSNSRVPIRFLIDSQDPSLPAPRSPSRTQGHGQHRGDCAVTPTPVRSGVGSGRETGPGAGWRHGDPPGDAHRSSRASRHRPWRAGVRCRVRRALEARLRQPLIAGPRRRYHHQHRRRTPRARRASDTVELAGHVAIREGPCAIGLRCVIGYD